MRAILLAGLVALGCAAAAAPALAPAKVTEARRATVGNALIVAPLAADTLVTTVRWTLPGNDGKGALDSITVNVADLTRGGMIHSVLPANAVSYVLRQPLPFRDATWEVTAQVCTWRGTGSNRVTCVNGVSAPFVYALTAPPAVTGVSVSNAGPP